MTDLKIVRLSKLMAERGICSRREADDLIARGLVMVDGETVSVLGTKVPVDCTIELSDSAQSMLQDQVTILINKPVGYVSSQPEKDYQSAIDLISAKNQIVIDRRIYDPSNKYGLAPAGRLDIDSRGLLVLTQDGALVRKIIGPDSEMEKEYHVTVRGQIDESKLRRMRSGLSLDGRRLLPAKVDQIAEARLKFILREGRKRQIRRMCEQVDLEVFSLLRVRIGRVHLRDLPEGHWRYLQPSEKF